MIVGKLFGILAFTPYYKWTESHHEHHQTVGNLDKRGDGDVWTMTVDEYMESSRIKKFIYRLFRHPVFLLLVAGPFNFFIVGRFTRRTFTKKQKRNVYFTNLMLVLMAGVAEPAYWLEGIFIYSNSHHIHCCHGRHLPVLFSASI